MWHNDLCGSVMVATASWFQRCCWRWSRFTWWFQACAERWFSTFRARTHWQGNMPLCIIICFDSIIITLFWRFSPTNEKKYGGQEIISNSVERWILCGLCSSSKCVLWKKLNLNSMENSVGGRKMSLRDILTKSSLSILINRQCKWHQLGLQLCRFTIFDIEWWWRSQDVKENAVLVYMKGVPDAPQCGFSAMVVRILDEYGTIYSSFPFWLLLIRLLELSTSYSTTKFSCCFCPTQ